MLSRNTFLVVSATVVTSTAGSKTLLPTTQHGYPRRAVLTAAAVALAPHPAAAKLLNPAVTWTQQEQLMRAHAARFEQSAPVAVRITSTAHRRLRELVATVDIPAHTRVAVYPVELVADTQEHDDTYAVAVYRSHGPRGEREPLRGVTGIPTEASLARAYIGGLPTIWLG